MICSVFSIVGALLTGHHMNVIAEFRMMRRELAEYQISDRFAPIDTRLIVVVLSGFVGSLLGFAPGIMLSVWLLIDPWFVAHNFSKFMILPLMICFAFNIAGGLLIGYHMNVVAGLQSAQQELARYPKKSFVAKE